MHAAGFEGSRRRHDDVRVAGGGVSDVAFHTSCCILQFFCAVWPRQQAVRAEADQSLILAPLGRSCFRAEYKVWFRGSGVWELLVLSGFSRC